MRPGAWREGYVYPGSAWRRFIWELGAKLFPEYGLQRQVPPGHRHAEFGDTSVERGRRRVSAEYRQLGCRTDRRAEHQGVLVGWPLSGRHDLEPHRAHGVL